MKVIINEDTIKNLPFEKYWDIQVKKGLDPSVDTQFEMVFNIRLFDDPKEIYNRLINYIGGEDAAISKAKELLEKLNPYEYRDEESELTITFSDTLELERNYDDFTEIYVDIDVDGTYLPDNTPIDVYYGGSPGDWFDFTDAIEQMTNDYFYDNITKKTGIRIFVSNVS